MKLTGLRGRKVVDRVRRRGNKWRGKHMQVTYVMGKPRTDSPKANQHEGLLLGTSASIKLNKSAVKRNRMRRRCRESLRLTAKEYNKLPTCQLILTPRSSSLSVDFAELRSDAEDFLTHLLKYAS